MDTNAAQANMLKQQIHTWDVLDEDVLQLLTKTPREHFVPNEYNRLAFADMQIPLAHEQNMMSPKVEARILADLQVQPSDKVLEVGTGSGYLTALLAQSAQYVYSLDIYDDFIEAAAKKLQELNIGNVTLQQGDAAQGWNKQQPYDIICITGSLPILPNTFLQQLKVGGRLFAIIGQQPAMQATLIVREDEKTWQQQHLFETSVSALLNAVQPDKFTF